MKVKVNNDQSLMNFALQHYGSIAGIAQMMADGVIDGFDSELVPGVKIEVTTPINSRVAEWYKENGVAVTTGDGYSSGNGEPQGAYSDGYDEGFE